jgi:hypothetical protein
MMKKERQKTVGLEICFASAHGQGVYLFLTHLSILSGSLPKEMGTLLPSATRRNRNV